jgi:Domain of unknown function (DUF4149)
MSHSPKSHPTSVISQAFTRTALWISLGGWVGSWAFFAFVVSRVAFRVLPGDVAGDLAGMLLAVLHWGGAGMALVAAVAAAALGRRGWLVWLPIGLAILCAGSELILAPEIAAVRPSTLGAAATEETSRRFGLLHGISLGLFLAIHAITIVLVLAHARLDAKAIAMRSAR